MYGFYYDGASNDGFYFYKRNLQGDIIGILNSSGAEVTTYLYDAWGKLLTKTGSLASTVGTDNPFRYRGYYYDDETSLYYLNQRYYNPRWRRFINADYFMGVTGVLLSHNVFAYCGNNPVMRVDLSGRGWLKSLLIGVAVAAAVVAVVAACVVTAGAAAPALAVAGGTILGGMSAGTAAVVAVGSACVSMYAMDAAEKVQDTVARSNVNTTQERGNTVYKLVNQDDKVMYIGITNNLARRRAQHKNDAVKGQYRMIPFATSLTRAEARAAEQVAISAYSLDHLQNAIRSIAKGRVDEFAEYMGAVSSIYAGLAEDELLRIMGR